MTYQFKVGDKGKTRDGSSYEVVAVVPEATAGLLAKVTGRNERMFIAHRLHDGCMGVGVEFPGDLLPPKQYAVITYRDALFGNSVNGYYTTRACISPFVDKADYEKQWPKAGNLVKWLNDWTTEEIEL